MTENPEDVIVESDHEWSYGEVGMVYPPSRYTDGELLERLEYVMEAGAHYSAALEDADSIPNYVFGEILLMLTTTSVLNSEVNRRLLERDQDD